eukprot:TRINITY_DN6456_c0_g3_i5.p1 TRINITY_DN6456_c0_g3~~TRINITY_DN6456_c0_g3_i5.p1  ORF type:complete len:551 (+),score=109.55 TRINITY_DN6456_c0_g3_i5:573-2225(+)
MKPPCSSVRFIFLSQFLFFPTILYFVLFGSLDTTNREVMVHLKAICFLRPTQENIDLLKKELRKPKYGEYYLFFSNILSKPFLEGLASADEHEVVKEVQEFFGDYYAVNTDCWTLNLPGPTCIDMLEHPEATQRTIDGLFSCLLSLKLRPTIRVQQSSKACIEVGKQLLVRMVQTHKGLFQTRSSSCDTTLLILDRFDDPVTPLLTQWTYQAMIHEMIGIEKNLVDLSKCVSNTKKELTQIVLSAEQDPFYRDNMLKNFGELGIAIRALVDDYSTKSKLNSNVQTLEDMKTFVKNYPEFKKLSGNVSKHMAIMTELQGQVSKRCLLDVSELEQSLACRENHEEAVIALTNMFANPKIEPTDLLRLVILYNLRYETHKEKVTHKFLEMLQDTNLPNSLLNTVQLIRSYSGIQSRSERIDLFGNQSFFAKTAREVKIGLLGVTNVFAQHKPLLAQTLEHAIKGTLPENTFPYIEGASPKTKGGTQFILVFMVGGLTYEEAAYVSVLNTTIAPSAVLLGGTQIHNSQSFLNGFVELFEKNIKLERTVIEEGKI